MVGSFGLWKMVASFFNRPPDRGVSFPDLVSVHPPSHLSWFSQP